jgi:hypothetical protein
MMSAIQVLKSGARRTESVWRCIDYSANPSVAARQQKRFFQWTLFLFNLCYFFIKLNRRPVVLPVVIGEAANFSIFAHEEERTHEKIGNDAIWVGSREGSPPLSMGWSGKPFGTVFPLVASHPVPHRSGGLQRGESTSPGREA